ncbi:MAG: Unknown protein [uncultured Campylobacterales bacterium]|uniref:Uncharacterized protein n=1 Tax=uncultured Campylobacterales bacterium TaxID=352960 RepID=A0A6S6S5L5_9BACT|nr:MAG: Unknown protein [uncultured Campylobacterales bacterium]
MNKQEYILFIFEGKVTEKIIFKNLKQYFLDKKEIKFSQDIVISYGTVIYKLYKDFFIDDELDDDLDLVTLLKPKNDKKEIINVEEVSEVYLFFDYDGHASNADDDKLLKMLNLFNDETDKGKLFVSYPMVEALRNIKTNDNFSQTIAISEQKYKKEYSKNCDEKFLHFNDYTKKIWLELIMQHSKKANFIVNGEFQFPDKQIKQFEIFNQQKIKYIETFNKVSVLSGFPMFLLAYYGLDKFNNDFFKEQASLILEADDEKEILSILKNEKFTFNEDFKNKFDL